MMHLFGDGTFALPSSLEGGGADFETHLLAFAGMIFSTMSLCWRLDTPSTTISFVKEKTVISMTAAMVSERL